MGLRMTTDQLRLDSQAVRGAFLSWSAEQEQLDAQLSESLSALVAYQSHLDDWQRQLAGDRDELREAREQFDRDRAAAEKDQVHSSTEADAELDALRQQNATLTAELAARDAELRELDSGRAGLATELETLRGHESELLATVEQLKQALHLERERSTEEIQQLHERLHKHAAVVAPANTADGPAQAPAAEPSSAPAAAARARSSNGAVLGSIVEQFGKLRQQRAVDRQAQKKAR
jgi:chromosome segregation ATPase